MAAAPPLAGAMPPPVAVTLPGGNATPDHAIHLDPTDLFVVQCTCLGWDFHPPAGGAIGAGTASIPPLGVVILGETLSKDRLVGAFTAVSVALWRGAPESWAALESILGTRVRALPPLSGTRRHNIAERDPGFARFRSYSVAG